MQKEATGKSDKASLWYLLHPCLATGSACAGGDSGNIHLVSRKGVVQLAHPAPEAQHPVCGCTVCQGNFL